MVTLDEMSKMLADEQNSAESVNQLAAQANETVAKCRELWNKYEAAHLAEETEEGPEPEFMDYGEEGPEPEFMDYEEEGPEPESMDYEEEGPEPEFMDYEEEGPEPEFMDYGEEGPEPMMAQMAEETEEALPPATPLAFDLGGPEEEGELALMDFNHMEPDMEPGMEPEPGLEPEPEAELEPAPIKGRFALRMIFGKDEEQAAPAVTETAAEAGPEIMPGIVAEAGPEIETLALEATAGEAPPLPEPVAAEVKPAKARRRSWGLPTLHVDAKDNNIEISAFNLNIKL